ncbi:MAG: hypothetical protein OXF02_02795 [Simkaniaceae bacterium]|nr:hypothetical protein [Simkaniaceae bacterium]
MVKEGIARTTPKNIITPVENIDPPPVITNQPAIAPEGAHQQNFGNVLLAPAVAVNNVAQMQLGGYKKRNVARRVVAGEFVVGSCCVAGTACGTAEITVRMGTTVAVTTGVAAGAGALVGLCVVGTMVATAGYYLVTK